MAKRPIFLPTPEQPTPVCIRYVDFQWHAGLAVTQKHKSIVALHDAARAFPGVDRLLEVSSKSVEKLGVALSAFNLTFSTSALHYPISVECAFQGGKVFEKGGPFVDMFTMAPRDAKRDERLQTSGRLTGFRFQGLDWSLEPQTAYYDWLYLNALKARKDLSDQISLYSGFTDIEFNPAKSISCQAYSVALFVSLRRANCLEEVTSSERAFLDFLESRSVDIGRRNGVRQGSLL